MDLERESDRAGEVCSEWASPRGGVPEGGSRGPGPPGRAGCKPPGVRGTVGWIVLYYE